MAINPGYFVGEAFQSFRRNWVMSLVAVTIIYISLLVMGAFFLTGTLLNKVVSSFEQKVSISIFLKDGAAPADVQALQQNLVGDKRIKGVDYVSKAQALEKFKERTKNVPQLVEQLRGNPLPASLEVSLVDPRQVREVVKTIEADANLAKVIKNPANPEADDIKYAQEVVDRLFQATNVVRLFVAVFMVLLFIVSLVLIGNTIRLAIYSRRREIGIMRLVGASNWFISTPFLMEGVIQSTIGSLLAILTLVLAQSFIVPWLQSTLRFLPVTITAAALGQLSGLLLLSGIVIGLIGSGLATSRYLKV
jgi:cell division transport system permease protein